jgi:surfactin synthase thioesterase subunit
VSGRTAPQLMDSDPSLSGLSDEELIAKLKDLNGTAKELLANPELVKMFLPIIRADFEMVETYIYEQERPLTCPIYAYGGTEDVTVTTEGLRAWQEQTSRKCEIRRFRGDHFFIHSSIQSIAAAVQNDVSVAQISGHSWRGY